MRTPPGASAATAEARIRRCRPAHISTAEVAEVLAGARSYDSLDDRQQALVRAAWDETIAADLDGGIDLGAEFRAAGETYSELDENGRIVTHPATS